MNKKINFIPAIGVILLCSFIVGVVVVLINLQMKDDVKISSFGKQKKGREEGVILVTDKIEYEKGEDVKITIKNNTDGQIEFWVIGIGQIEYKENANIWNVIRFDIDCPCEAKCEKVSVVFNPGKEREFIWDQKGDDCNQVDAGKYKARTDWRDLTREYFEIPAVTSNEFIIK